MKKVEIQVGEAVIELKFGYGVLRRLSEKWGINSIQGVFERFGSFQNKDEMGFEQLNIFGDLVWAAASNSGVEIDSDEAVDVLMSNPEKMQEIVFEFMKSLPQPKEGEKKTQAQAKVKK
ncbi:hypothetical protein [Myroides odoratimimus]|uniref:hypothetical protein n=1 Tax=Myroides odoratimimus TaxID=76832 RepID=UPI0029BFEE96|nr:hypothetical protein [Myroides odoratimimus]MDX4973712.1 hypothetical protein [Myroides odoratimimus]